MNELKKMLLAYQEGGEWHVVDVHSLVMPDGQRWDARNGWTGPCDETPEEFADRRAATWRRLAEERGKAREDA